MSQRDPQKAKRTRRTKQEIAESDEFFVKEVQANKDLLFGQLSSSVTSSMKNDKWEEIRAALVDKGDKLLAKKDSKYIQSAYWQEVRRKTIERVDKLKVTTGAEPKDEELSPVRFKIFNDFYSIF